MMTTALRGGAGRLVSCLLLACLAAALVPVNAAIAWPYGVDHSIFYLDSQPDSLKPAVELSDDASDAGQGGTDRSRAKTIVGASLFGSGIFLCSWGIVAWQTDDTQCCPTNNTQNVIKIVTGVLLLNAGLIYLLELQ